MTLALCARDLIPPDTLPPSGNPHGPRPLQGLLGLLDCSSRVDSLEEKPPGGRICALDVVHQAAVVVRHVCSDVVRLVHRGQVMEGRMH
eukprot:1270184-Prymnesium_polylepis.1